MATVSKMSKAIWVIAYFWHLVPRRIAVIQCTVMVRNIANTHSFEEEECFD